MNKKAQSLVVCHDGNKKLDDGDYIMVIQANREGVGGLVVNIDWSFDPKGNKTEIKSVLGGFLGCIEDVFGEKMVTEMVAHWAEDTGRNIENGVIRMRSKGLDFKDSEGGED